MAERARRRARRAKRAKRTNPLGPRASRVKKARAPRAELPSWYYRVLRLRWDQSPFGYKDSKVFDEDLSELEEESEQKDDAEQLEEEENDCESERSYAGSDADLYYEFKQEREERKREKLREQKNRKRGKLQGQKYKARQLELEKSKEEEVRAEYESLGGQTNLLSWLAKPGATPQVRKEPTPIPLESLAEQEFKLFCSDHVKYVHEGSYYDEKAVFFWQPDASVYDELKDGLKDPNYETGMLYGELDLGSYVMCNFGPFWPPSRASRKPVKVESDDGKHEISFQFLGNGYLKLRVSRNFVFMDSDRAKSKPPPPPSAPREFEFVGIWYDRHKAFVERQNALVEEKKRRSPSPRESWFELNHPMGAYYNGRGWYS